MTARQLWHCCEPALRREIHPWRLAFTGVRASSLPMSRNFGIGQVFNLADSSNSRRMLSTVCEADLTKWSTTSLTRTEVEKIFQSYDVDGDGFIDLAEIRTVLRGIGRNVDDKQVIAEMEVMDTSGDGRIDYYEFMDFWLGSNKQAPSLQADDLDLYCAAKQKAAEMGEAKHKPFMKLISRFKALDHDGDGLLSPTELFSGLANEHPTFSPQEIEEIVSRMFRDVDKDNDGKIDFLEFASQFLMKEQAPSSSQSPVAIAVEETPSPKSVEEKIVKLLDERVKPFVQQDGSDVTFNHFDRSDGTLHLIIQESGPGTAHSHATLLQGVENVMDFYIPDVKQIVCHKEEAIPGPRY